MPPPSASLKKQTLSSAFKWESYSADPTWSENALVLQPGLFEQTNDIKELRSEAGPR